MEIHVVEAQIVAQGMDMHLSHTLGVVAGLCELACQGVLIPPGDAVLVSHTAVVALLMPVWRAARAAMQLGQAL